MTQTIERHPAEKPADQAAGQRSSPDRTVHVIDDDAAIRQAVRMLLRSAEIPVQVYSSGESFLDALRTLEAGRIGCVLTDIRMPGLSGLDLLRSLRDRGFRQPVIVMTAHGNVSTAVQAMKLGAADFVEKPFDGKALLTLVESALSGALRTAGGPDPASASAAERVASLSPREREVLNLLMEGKSTKIIARELDLSPRTVEIHRARLLARLEVSSLAEAVRLAVLAEVK